MKEQLLLEEAKDSEKIETTITKNKQEGNKKSSVGIIHHTNNHLIATKVPTQYHLVHILLQQDIQYQLHNKD